jgi:uncharacterized membrane protein
VKVLIAITGVFVFAAALQAHEQHARKNRDEGSSKANKVSHEEINKNYLRYVKPIFQKKCFDCHSSQTKYPWYFKLPIVKQWIENDIAEAREHIDMDADFPFKGHGSPLEDLKAMEQVIRDDSMPPLSYRMMHSRSGLTEDEKTTVRQWIESSLTSLRK